MWFQINIQNIYILNEYTYCNFWNKLGINIYRLFFSYESLNLVVITKFVQFVLTKFIGI